MFVAIDWSNDEEASIARREITPYANFEHARSWINQCVKFHRTCSRGKEDKKQSDPPLQSLQFSATAKSEDSVLPTRIIDVGSADGFKRTSPCPI
jgi:hypothetical protein